MLEHVRAIVLRTHRYGEADLIVHVLTEKGQKLSLIARSAIKSKKRFGGGMLEPTHCLKISFKRAKESGEARLDHLQEASLDESFPALRTDFSRLELGIYFLRLISGIVKEGDLEQPALFNILGHGLRGAEVTSDPQLLRSHFEAKLLAQQGVLPYDEEFRSLLEKPLHLNSELSLGDEIKLRQRNRLNQLVSAYANI